MNLWTDEYMPEDFGNDTFKPYLELFPLQISEPVDAVLVIPGGGYVMRADYEGAPVARAYNTAGFHAFVVQYRVAPSTHLAALTDVIRAIRLIRSKADDWGIQIRKLALCGFSAGGHLAALASVHNSYGDPEQKDSVDLYGRKPDAQILAYPWITNKDEPPSDGEREVRYGEAEEYLSLGCCENFVSEKTPPAFIWHTFDDTIVPVEHSLLYADRLNRKGVPFELHIYEKGDHGMGLAFESDHINSWVELSCQWLKEL